MCVSGVDVVLLAVVEQRHATTDEMRPHRLTTGVRLSWLGGGGLCFAARREQQPSVSFQYVGVAARRWFIIVCGREL